MQAHSALPSMPLEPYEAQQARLPASGRHFVANTCSSTDTIVVYQAYRPSIAKAAVDAQRLSASPAYQTDRMTWVKPGFMWMMHRSGWASKHNQQCIIAVHLKKQWLFDRLRSNAILSVHSNAGKTKNHDVVVQWDPDHDYLGQKLERRAVQIGLRGATAKEYAAGVQGPAVVKIEDITEYVCSMRDNVVQHLSATAPQQHKLDPTAVQDLDTRPTEAAITAVAVAQNLAKGELLSQLMVPTEDVVQLDPELQAVLGLVPGS